MSRFLIFNQYPARMRYQEWWESELVSGFKPYFDDVIKIDGHLLDEQYSTENFSPMHASLYWESTQIQNAIDIIQDGDILFCCDISYPGLVPQLVFHYKYNPIFGYCHATSLNNMDIFEDARQTKYPVERAIMESMSGVFFGTHYSMNKHYNNGKNGHVVGLPAPSWYPNPWFKINHSDKTFDVGIISRRCAQKVDETLLSHILDAGFSVGFHDHTVSTSWETYLRWISNCRCIVSLAKEETYGYQVMDCESVGVPFIAPNDYGYREVIRPEFLYSNKDKLIKLVSKYRKCDDNKHSMSDWAVNSSKDWFKNISKIVLEH